MKEVRSKILIRKKLVGPSDRARASLPLLRKKIWRTIQVLSFLHAQSRLLVTRLRIISVETCGKRNSIEVCVMNDDQFVNWTNQHPLRVIYDSQKVTQGTVKVILPTDGGTYHVVFNNEFSVLTPKAVETSLILKYAQ